MCKSDVSRREVKPDAMMTEMIELYKKLVVKVVKEEEEEDKEGVIHSINRFSK